MAGPSVTQRPLPPVRPLPPRVDDARAAPTPPNATVVDRVDVSRSVARFRIRLDARPPHVEPGQYLSLGLVIDGRLVQRPYSTATQAGVHDELEFLIRLVPGGSFTPRLWSIRVGDRLRVGPPKGLFTRIAGDGRTHLFIATGTGLAPFVAMFETMLLEPAPPRTVVIHGVSHAEDLAYRERFQDWAADGLLAYEPSISRPGESCNAGWTGRTGRIGSILQDVWAAHDLAPRDTVAYLCGNPEMIASGTHLLADRGMPRDAIRSEHYWPG